MDLAHGLGGCRHAQLHALICLRHGCAVHKPHEALAATVSFQMAAAAEGHGLALAQGALRSTPDLLVLMGLADAQPLLDGRGQHGGGAGGVGLTTYDQNLPNR